MTQEDKELLLKDLCARLPYGVIVQGNEKYISEIDSIEKKCGIIYLINVDKSLLIDQIKPYLRPMSSMTEEERGQYMDFIEWSHNDYDGTTTTCINKERLYEYLNFIYSHHFDYRGLIEKGLALEAPEGMYN